MMEVMMFGTIFVVVSALVIALIGCIVLAPARGYRPDRTPVPYD
jgi:hypothetical protein